MLENGREINIKIMCKFTNKNLYYREFLYQDNRCNTEFS